MPRNTSLPNLASLLHRAVQQLTASPTPRLDAEVLAMHVLGLSRAQLITQAEQPLTAVQRQQFETLLARRVKGEPVAHLVGEREFWSLRLGVTPDTLIPRPETELLVEHALARIPREATWTVADLGTGSGAIALAIATERPTCRVIATDTSPAALAMAAKNAGQLALATIEFRQGDWLQALKGERVDLLVSNPPYIAAADPHLQQGDLRFEPRAALAAGDDGLGDLRHLIAHAHEALRHGGWLLLEHGHDQKEAVQSLMRRQGWHHIRTFQDLASQDRVSECQLP